MGDAPFDGPAGEREVTWVRVLKARPPAFEALDPGDLAVVPADALAAAAPDAARLDAIVALLAGAKVPAVLLLDDHHGRRGAGARDAFADLGVATTAAGIPTFRLANTDPTALERSIIGFLVNERTELDRRAAELEAQLARFALAERGLDVQAAAIGAFLGRAVVIEGRRGDHLAVFVPPDDPAAASAVARYLADSTSTVALRVGIAGPAGAPGPGGRLVLLGGGSANELDRIAAERVAGLLGVELARDAAVRQQREVTRPGDELPADGPPWVVLLASQESRPRDTPRDTPRASANGGAMADELVAREQVRTDLRLLFSDGRLMLRGTAESLELRMVAAATAEDPAGLWIAARLAEFLGRTVAVSRPFHEAGARPAIEAATRSTLEAALALPHPPVVARADREPAYRLLGNLRNLPDGTRQATELLSPILVGRSEVQAERLATLRTVLDAPSLGEAAARLGVHRNTVRYRVARLEELGGWDLSDPDLRVALSIAARLVHPAQ